MTVSPGIFDVLLTMGRALSLRRIEDAIRYLVLVNATVGSTWLTPALFRFGASSLLNDLLMQRTKQLRGVYVRPDEFSGD